MNEEINNREIVDNIIKLIAIGDYNSIIESHNQFNPNFIDNDGYSLLHYACLTNSTNIIKYLIYLNVNINQINDNNHETPIFNAIRKSYYNTIVLLLNNNIDLSIKSNEGYDSLHLAIRLGDVLVIYLLLAHGANPNTLDKEFLTPLLYLLKYDINKSTTLSIVRLLIYFNADVTIKDNEFGNSSLHYLAYNGNHNITSFTSNCCSKSTNVILAYIIHNAGGLQLAVDRNNNNKTAYSIALLHSNSKLTLFLQDMLIYLYCPKQLVILNSFTIVSLLVILITLCGYIYGIALFLIVYVCLLRYFNQSTIYAQADSYMLGFYLSIQLIQLYTYLKYYLMYNNIIDLLYLTSLLIVIHIFIKLRYTKPRVLTPLSRAELIDKIQQSSPLDGLSEHQSKLRLCTHCMADKRQATSHCRYCNHCVIGLDHHFLGSGVCIGYGNRRLYCVFLFLYVGHLLICFLAMLINHAYDIESNSFLSSLQTNRLLLSVKIITIGMFLFFGSLLWIQLVLIVRDSTVFNSYQNRLSNERISLLDKAIYTKLQKFLLTGLYAIRYNSNRESNSNISDDEFISDEDNDDEYNRKDCANNSNSNNSEVVVDHRVASIRINPIDRV